MTTVEVGPLVITSEFDSGNILRVELVQLVDDSHNSQGSSNQSVNVHNSDYEINLWTKPDCQGTRYENGNRTWFYFAVKGGRPQAMIKLNVLNLNKQVKLFVQGMQPVYRIVPDKPNWERIRDRLVINETGEHVCSISFRYRLPENIQSATTYFAFTYPFSYSEMCEMLENFNRQFAQPMAYPLNQTQYLTPIENEIYYHRECVCYSLEGRRVELITISSCYGISKIREKKLDNLFPIKEEERPFMFPTKKVVFLSARVHPGETPSSFVLHGFMKFILDKEDPRAHVLRRMFVFKFIPILNPDGVARGHYRTDPRGVNLNRVYLTPSPVLHSSIYAARKLLLYYHHGVDMLDDYVYPTEEIEPEKESDFEDDKANANITVAEESDVKFSSCSSFGDNNFNLSGKSSDNNLHKRTKKKKSYKFVLSEANSLCAGCGPFIDVDKEIGTGPSGMSEDCEPGTSGAMENSVGTCVQHQCAFEACDEDSVFYETLEGKVASTNVIPETLSLEKLIEEKEDTVRPPSSRSRTRRSKSKLTMSDKKKGAKKTLSKKKKGSVTEWFEKVENEDLDDLISQTSVGTSKRKPKGRKKSAGKTGINYSSSNRFHDSSSGLFLYVDMHGHTTKRGIFMYGNHFPDVATQAECMLLPRLMALNCQHFDFAACNFTERLMNMKDRRDGASREGSGRVACLKLTGLVRSYTLECNYNTGRIVNHCVSRPTCFGINDPPPQYTHHPPKFTPELFELTGRGLAESLLDLTGHNPWSRLNLTEFKSVEGVRRSLVKRLKCSPEYKPCARESISKKIPPTIEDTSAIFTPKVTKKTSNKLIGLSPQGGPLGPRRENQNSLSPAPPAKASGSRTKAPVSCVVPIPGSSTILERPDKAAAKVNLKKMFKSKKVSPKFSRKGKKSDKQ